MRSGSSLQDRVQMCFSSRVRKCFYLFPSPVRPRIIWPTRPLWSLLPISASSCAAKNGSHSVAGLWCLHPSPEKGLKTPGLEFVRGKDNENIFIKKKKKSRRVYFFFLMLHLCYVFVQGPQTLKGGVMRPRDAEPASPATLP